MKKNGSLEALIQALRCLPGVGPKSAQRMAWHLLQHDREAAAVLGTSILDAIAHIHHCQQCNTLTEQTICETCSNPERDPGLLCVVETPADQYIIEQTLTFKGLYFVLMGRISPLDGLGPKEIQLEKLVQRASDGVVKEVVLATNFNNEGEATAHYIGEILRARGLQVTRPARGVPVGGELEYVDPGTLARAILDRR